LHRFGKRVLQRLLGQIEVSEEPDERSQHPARLGSERQFDRGKLVFDRIFSQANPSSSAYGRQADRLPASAVRYGARMM
jgi:hypothetical protein